MMTSAKRSGFTLVEVILYVAIFTAMVLFIAGIVWRVADSGAANRGRANLAAEADFAFAKVKWALSGATAISEPAASSTGSALTVIRYNFGENPVAFQVASGALVMSRAGGPAVALTSSNVRVVTFSATHAPSVINVPESIQIKLALAASSSEPGVLASTTLQGVFYLRQ
jgi:Tfp pilus assembly protein FimT